ncbi:MAG: hypothetical protein IT581_02285 [Verrucomicrobiales bacterium]|nr:hypothetical protein [Verrucomicrobiales bacterium]
MKRIWPWVRATGGWFVRRAAGLVVMGSLMTQVRAAVVERELPDAYLPGAAFEVVARVIPDGGTRVVVVEDAPPTGWLVDGVSHGGVWDSRLGRVKWGPFTDDAARRLGYRVTPPLAARGVARFSGSVAMDLVLLPIGGREEVALRVGSAEAEMPGLFVPGASFLVQWSTTPLAGTAIQLFEEQLPVGWLASEVSDGGWFDERHGKVKWGAFFDDFSRQLTYRAHPPTNAAGAHAFEGIAQFDDATSRVGGGRTATAARNRVARSLPSGFRPGGTLTVTLDAVPLSNVVVYAVEERVPRGWRVDSVSDGGVVDASSGRVRWGPFVGAAPRQLSMVVTPPSSGADAVAVFQGIAAFDQRTVEIEGTQEINMNAGDVVRDLPQFYSPLIAIEVRNAVVPAPGVRAYAVEDSVPAGWSVANISHGGIWDAAAGKVKWGPFRDGTTRSLTFRTVPSQEARGAVTFKGSASFDGVRGPIEGANEVEVSLGNASRVLPAEYGPGEVIDVLIRSVPATSTRVQTFEEKPPVGWVVSDIGQGGVWDALRQKVKWGPFSDSSTRNLTYRVRPGADARGGAEFAGMAQFDDLQTTVAGSNVVLRAANTDAGQEGTTRMTVTDTSPHGNASVQWTPMTNGWRLQVRAPSSSRWAIEESTDLVAWRVVGELAVPESGVAMVPEPRFGAGTRFFRLRALGSVDASQDSPGD